MTDKDDVKFIKGIIQQIAKEEAEKVARSCCRIYQAVFVESSTAEHPGKVAVRLVGEQTTINVPFVDISSSSLIPTAGDTVHVVCLYDNFKNAFAVKFNLADLNAVQS